MYAFCLFHLCLVVNSVIVYMSTSSHAQIMIICITMGT